MTNKYLKPMLDPGSSRVFNCNVVTAQLLAKDPNAELFFRNKPLNGVILIKDAAPQQDSRIRSAAVGTKIYFPFNVGNIYEGGRTIFLHDRQLEGAITEQYGEGALSREALAYDMRLLGILDRLPSLDPFLMKDMFLRQQLAVNDAYFSISQEAWDEIELFMLERFEPLVKAAFPDAMASDDKARQLINTIWEARDLAALKPLIEAFRLPQMDALDIFASWKGIVYYTFQYQRVKPDFAELLKWLMANETSATGMPDSKDVVAALKAIKEQLRQEWQTIEGIVRRYETSYDKMFKLRAGSADFLAFLKDSNKTYWDIGSSLGKTGQAIYCWRIMTGRFAGKLPWPQLLELAKLLAAVLPTEKKSATAVAW